MEGSVALQFTYTVQSRNQYLKCIQRTPTNGLLFSSDEVEELCQDVGVTRLVSNTEIKIPGATAGVVFIKHKTQWGTVCDDAFRHHDARVRGNIDQY